MRKYSLLFLLFIFIAACQKEVVKPTEATVNESQFLSLETEVDLEKFEAFLENNEIANSRGNQFGKKIILEGETHNALQKAINDAGRFGLVVLKGTHHEETTVKIEHPVYILGQNGAKIISAVKVQEETTDGILRAAIHVNGVRRVTIWGVDFQTKTDVGGIAVLIEDSPRTVLSKNKMTNYQIGVAVEQGDDAIIWKNEIATTTKGLTGEVFEVYGILVVNGDRVRILKNKITNAFFGMCMCDKGGVSMHNETYGNFIGQLLCNYVPDVFFLESGATGSEEAANKWILRDNYSHDNFDAGYLVIDDANNNILIDNQGGNNATYDIELATDSYRFGFLTPKSFENKVNAGKYPNVTIKDCGENNVVRGGVRINIELDPCL